MTQHLFDRQLRSLRRDRAAQMGPELLLYDRAFADCLDRLRDISRPFERALLVGCPSAEWPGQLAGIAAEVDIVDPGELFAARAHGLRIDEDRFDFGAERYDLIVAVGTLDSVNELPLALHLMHRALRPDSVLIGAVAGGHSLPALRASLIDAGRAIGRITARTHPRIEASSLAGLLSSAGFAMPVVDVDRVRLRYETLDGLVQDLRAMAATSVLASHSPAMTRAELRHARHAFASRGKDGRTEEVVEILHFLGWSEKSGKAAN